MMGATAVGDRTQGNETLNIGASVGVGWRWGRSGWYSVYVCGSVGESVGV